MSNSVVKLDRPSLPSAAATEATALMSILERAALDPAFDPDRLKQVLDLYERASARSAKTAYLAALAEMQPNLPIVERHGVIARKAKDGSGEKVTAKPTKYALWEDVMEALQPVLAQHGFSLTFRIAQPTPDRVHVTGILGHRDGHSEDTTMSLPIDDTGAKNNAQGWGSSVSYGKRYTAGALLNFVSRGEDDDGKATGAPATVSEEQAQSLRAALKFKDIAEDRFCKKYKIARVEELPSTLFDEANKAIARHTA